MSDLSVLREGWDSLHREETGLLRATTVQESVSQWAQLQTAFEWQLQQTSSLFERDRWNALEDLQARLRRLAY